LGQGWEEAVYVELCSGGAKGSWGRRGRRSGLQILVAILVIRFNIRIQRSISGYMVEKGFNLEKIRA
jgi:hypothetical protein